MSRCMHYIFCQGREVKHSDKSVMKKGGEGKTENGPSGLGWKMDRQACVHFELKQTVVDLFLGGTDVKECFRYDGTLC